MFTAKDDLLHPIESSDRWLVETQAWGFYIPEAQVNAGIYMNFRPNLGLTYAGIYVWDDFCRNFTDACYFDARSYLPMPSADLDNFQLGNGYSCRVIEPLRRYELAYEPGGDTHFELTFEALAEPVGFTSSPESQDYREFAPGHLDQVGRIRGQAVVHGARFPVDCITHRDRSWNSIRREDLGYSHKIDWHSGHFGEDFWFQFFLWHEDEEGTVSSSGHIYKEGRPVKLARAERQTPRWDRDGIEPREIRLGLVDEEGDRYEIEGRMLNMFPVQPWFNIVAFCGLAEWRWAGRLGYGDIHTGRTVDWVIRQRQALRNK